MSEKSDIEKGIEAIDRQGKEGTGHERAAEQLRDIERADTPSNTADKPERERPERNQ